MMTHTWPEQNSASLSVMEDDQVESVLDGVRRLDHENTDIGIRAFVWDLVASY
jgi:hypothetical protein